MTPYPDTQWCERAAALAAALAGRGILRSKTWRAAVEQTPRHTFVPVGADTGEDGSSAKNPDADTWLDQVYSDSTLVVQRRQAPGGGPASFPSSSSTMPSLMIEMLESSDIHDGHRVLEIGTGTGYNVALLAHRLGSENVVSIDIDPDLIEVAKQRLEKLGLHPKLVAGDGLAGVPDFGPYDRIIATCAVPEIPTAWIEQLKPGGSMLVNVRGHIAGVLCLLVKQDDNEVIGPVIRPGGDFMWLRQDLDSPLRVPEYPVRIGAQKVARSFTELPPASVRDNRHFAWLLQLGLPRLRMFCSTDIFDPIEKRNRPGLLLYAEDGSHAQAVIEPENDGQHRVIQGGPRRLWDTVETTHKMWTRLADPAPHRFGVVANQTVQFVWLDNDMDWLRWPLPLV